MNKVKIAIVGNLTLESLNGVKWEVYNECGECEGTYMGEVEGVTENAVMSNLAM